MNLSVIERTENLTFISLAGSLNLAGVQHIEKQFLAETTDPKKSTVVDFSGVDFIGSMGMRLLITATKALDHEGKKLVLLNPRPGVDKVLESAGMANVLGIAHSEAAARALALA